MAEIDELDSLFDDASFDEGDMDDFLKMVNSDGVEDIFGEDIDLNIDLEDTNGSEDVFENEASGDFDFMSSLVENSEKSSEDNESAPQMNPLDLFEDEDDGSSFMTASMDAEEQVDSFGIVDDWNAFDGLENSKAGESSDNLVNADNENSSFTELDNLFAGVEETAEVPETLPKKTLIQKIVSLFTGGKSTEEREQIKEKKKLEAEAEAAEEAEYQERLDNIKSEKKKVKKEADAAKKIEADKKKQEKKAEQTAKTAAKKAAAAAKKAAAAAKKAEKEKEKGGPIPKSQLVPVKPLIVFIILGIAACVVIVFGSQTNFYAANVKEARELFIHQHYGEAFKNLLGLEIKEKDKEFYNQVEVVNLVDDKLNSYYSYIEINRYEEALNSLLGGVREYNDNEAKAGELGLFVEFRDIYDKILTELRDRYGIDETKANEMISMTLSGYKKELKTVATRAAVKDGVSDGADVESSSEN